MLGEELFVEQEGPLLTPLPCVITFYNNNFWCACQRIAATFLRYMHQNNPSACRS
jgi:hypothetical protein